MRKKLSFKGIQIEPKKSLKISKPLESVNHLDSSVLQTVLVTSNRETDRQRYRIEFKQVVHKFNPGNIFLSTFLNERTMRVSGCKST